MSSLVVEVCKVEDILPHENADRMKIARVKGWNTCIRYNPDTKESQFKVGQLCVFFPPDSILPKELAEDRLGIMNYLSPLPKEANGKRPGGGRVRATRLRGVPSYGVIMAIDPKQGDDPNWEVGTDVAEHFGVTKWEPPVKCIAGDAEKKCTKFIEYTDIENYGNFPDAIPNGEEVVITEKIHGSNCRVGFVLDDDKWLWMAGSHTVRRKQLDTKGKISMYWEPLTDNVKRMLLYIRDIYAKKELGIKEPIFSIIMFCEIYGSGIQDMTYGFVNGKHSFRAFDICVNFQYVDYKYKVHLFEKFGIEYVPCLFRGCFSADVVDQYTPGETVICNKEDAGKFKGREGIVITPIKEQSSKVLGGRMILKSLSADYLGRKNGTDNS